ncbi:MAG: hypothetical protein KatS3mg056_2223 [Chloroflexus sp.]|jgi:hypothetical protein|nr:MAG: hypothetical protein KatS3mg056_2223 [Chloroflexus sp.]
MRHRAAPAGWRWEGGGRQERAARGVSCPVALGGGRSERSAAARLPHAKVRFLPGGTEKRE